MKSAVRIALCIGILCSGLWAQNVSQISGSVRDQSGAVLPGVEIAVTQTETGVSRNVVSDETGSYVVPSLPVGPYRLEAALPGFRTHVQTGIVLQVNSNPVINVLLEVGAISEQVEVEANATMVETRSTGVGQVIDNQRVLELPLNGRQVTELLLLSGAATASVGGSVSASGFNTNRNYPTTPIAVAGGSPGGTVFVLDGASHNDPGTNTNMPVPFPDALQEFKTETSALPARYGQHASAAVTLVTKSGTNSFHGSAFEFVRNGIFNARNAFALRGDTLKRNQFGGAVGGPIIKNKLFFFSGYQGTINHSDPSTSITFVPTQAMLAGDFTGLASPACNAGRQITLSAPFVGNRVNPALFDPAAVKFTEYVPVSADPCGRYQYGFPILSSEHQMVSKVDYQMNNNHSIFGRYFISRFNVPAYTVGKNALNTPITGQLAQGQSFVLGDTYSFSPTLVNAFRATLLRPRNDRVTARWLSPTDVGVKMTSLAPKYTALSVTGAFAFGGGDSSDAHYNYTAVQLANDVDLIRGAHQIAFGVNYLHGIQNAFNSQNMNGSFGFSGQRLGLGMADFLMGYANSFSQGGAVEDVERSTYFSPYIQDVWKVNTHLTVSAGVRWEPYFPMKTRFDHVNHFDMAAFLAGRKSKVWANAPAGMLYPGDDGYPGRSLNNGSLNVFAPRLGLVIDPRGGGREVIRVAYGIFNDLPPMFFYQGIAGSAPWGGSTALTDTQLSDPWAIYPGGNPFPQTANKNVVFPFFAGFTTVPLKVKPWYTQQWNLSIQKQLGTDWSVSLSYLGNKTTHYWSATQINPAIYIPGTSTTANVNQRRRLYLTNPAIGQYYGGLTQLDPGANANYNGGLLSVQKRLSHDISFLANYTYSHCLNETDFGQLISASAQDPDNRAAEKASCLADRHHTVNATAVLNTPQFESRSLRLVASGWQLSTIFKTFSGLPLTVTSGRDYALTGQGSQRPNVISNPKLDHPTFAKWFDTAAFTIPGGGQYGNLGRNTIRGPGAWNVDAAVVRKFSITETQKLELRVEAFNLFNHLRPGNPNTSMVSTLFGQITTADDPRIMQFALKYVF